MSKTAEIENKLSPMPSELTKPVAPQKKLRTQLEERVTKLSAAISKATNDAVSSGASLANRMTQFVQSHPFLALSFIAGMIGSVIGARYFLSDSPTILPTCRADICPINPQCIPTDLTSEENLQLLLPSTPPRLLIQERIEPIPSSSIQPRVLTNDGVSPAPLYKFSNEHPDEEDEELEKALALSTSTESVKTSLASSYDFLKAQNGRLINSASRGLASLYDSLKARVHPPINYGAQTSEGSEEGSSQISALSESVKRGLASLYDSLKARNHSLINHGAQTSEGSEEGSSQISALHKSVKASRFWACQPKTIRQPSASFEAALKEYRVQQADVLRSQEVNGAQTSEGSEEGSAQSVPTLAQISALSESGKRGLASLYDSLKARGHSLINSSTRELASLYDSLKARGHSLSNYGVQILKGSEEGSSRISALHKSVKASRFWACQPKTIRQPSASFEAALKEYRVQQADVLRSQEVKGMLRNPFRRR